MGCAFVAPWTKERDYKQQAQNCPSNQKGQFSLLSAAPSRTNIATTDKNHTATISPKHHNSPLTFVFLGLHYHFLYHSTHLIPQCVFQGRRLFRGPKSLLYDLSNVFLSREQLLLCLLAFVLYWKVLSISIWLFVELEIVIVFWDYSLSRFGCLKVWKGFVMFLELFLVHYFLKVKGLIRTF